jgi:hypothetical protein
MKSSSKPVRFHVSGCNRILGIAEKKSWVSQLEVSGVDNQQITE